jgi:hypothetical protein
VRRNAALVVGTLAGALAAVLFRRRTHERVGAPAGDPRAEELRRRLAETRAAGDEVERAASVSETGEDAGPSEAEVEEMRKRVHDEGRAAAEKMRRSAEGDDAPAS